MIVSDGCALHGPPAGNTWKPGTPIPIPLFERAAMASPAPPTPRYDATSPAEDADDAADDEWHFVNARGAREGPVSAAALARALGTDAARWASTWVWCADRCAAWTPAARADALSARAPAAIAIARGGGATERARGVAADEEKPASPYEDVASRGGDRATTTTTFGVDADAAAAAAAAAAFISPPPAPSSISRIDLELLDDAKWLREALATSRGETAVATARARALREELAATRRAHSEEMEATREALREAREEAARYA